uniref:Uncharacterized protein n=1 Tax=Anguilla anguilla TaxID=7936 RepID=A0A0E9XCW8_ANGAN
MIMYVHTYRHTHTHIYRQKGNHINKCINKRQIRVIWLCVAAKTRQ